VSTNRILALLALIFAVLSIVPFPEPWSSRAPTWLLAIAVLLLAVMAFAT
jgi:hypothetical protein